VLGGRSHHDWLGFGRRNNSVHQSGLRIRDCGDRSGWPASRPLDEEHRLNEQRTKQTNCSPLCRKTAGGFFLFQNFKEQMIAKTNFFIYYLVVFVFATELSARIFPKRGHSGSPSRAARAERSGIFLKMGSRYIQHISPTGTFKKFERNWHSFFIYYISSFGI